MTTVHINVGESTLKLIKKNFTRPLEFPNPTLINQHLFNRSIVIKKKREILVVAYIFKRLTYLNVEKNDALTRPGLICAALDF